jgi:hypothetical protein
LRRDGRRWIVEELIGEAELRLAPLAGICVAVAAVRTFESIEGGTERCGQAPR